MRVFWPWVGGILIATVLFGLLFVLFRGRYLRVADHRVFISHLPKEFEGFRIALISDLHDRRFGKENQILAKAVLATSPDLVVTAGDLHEPPHSPEPVYALFSALSSAVLTTYTEGNHDIRKGRGTLSEEEYARHLARISQAGAVILNDRVLPLERNGKLLLLYGQSWREMVRGTFPALDPQLPSVAVCHDPLQFDRLDPLPDLLLSGHVHGGILRLPFLGPVFSPGNGTPVFKRFGRQFFFPKYSRGLYYKGKHTLAVSQGLGFSILPIRFIRPEIMVLTLSSREKMNIS